MVLISLEKSKRKYLYINLQNLPNKAFVFCNEFGEKGKQESWSWFQIQFKTNNFLPTQKNFLFYGTWNEKNPLLFAHAHVHTYIIHPKKKTGIPDLEMKFVVFTFPLFRITSNCYSIIIK